MFRSFGERAFTLFELMFIVLLIAILVAIAFPLLGGTATNARLRNCQANLRTIDGAIQQYHSESDAYPSDITDLVTAGFLRANPECPHTNSQDYFLNNKHDRSVCSQGHTIP